jgi:hypothetical protein
MRRLSSMPPRRGTPVASWRGQSPPAGFGAVSRFASTNDLTRATRPDAELTDPVNATRKACFGTSVVYSCEDRECPVRERCQRSVSPWRF